MMLGAKRMREIAQRVLGHSAADQTEVLLLGEDTQLTRFANSRIHQNVAERNVEVRVRVVSDRKVGVTTVNDLSDRALQQAVQEALQSAMLQPENPEFLSLPSAQPIPEVEAYVQATADCSPIERARDVGKICNLAAEDDLTASGTFRVSSLEICVANSLGVFAHSPRTASELTAVIMSDDSSGYASMSSTDVRELNAEAIAREAIGKALRSRNPRSIETGEYTVILEEYAVADLVLYMAYLGFSALAVQEGRSFMTNRFGQPITGEDISIWDDGLDPTGMPMPFDFEGVPKQRVDIITEGVAQAVVHDTYTAGREGTQSTGHALPAPNTYGPLPMNLFMKPGEATKDEMLASVERGLWVTRFHYVNPVHPQKAILTGMTRDGTFWIEHGEIKAATKNLRFTQPVLEALSGVRMIGKETRLQRGFGGGIRVPALCLERFAFTGVTQF